MEISGAGPDPARREAVPPSRYVGEVHIETLPTPFEGRLEVRLVWLEAGARSRPHTGGSGRMLHVLRGEAVVADPATRTVVGPGDTVAVPAGEWHWHGALPHVGAVLLVVERPGDLSFDVAGRDWAIGYGAANPHRPPA